MAKRRKYQDVGQQTLPEPLPPENVSTELSSGEAPTSSSNLFAKGLLPLQWIGSLTTGIVLMILLILVLAWGTFIENTYGTAVANFVLYKSSWFSVLLGLLALNILCSMIVRLPWKRRHFPFLAAHAGILILLIGSFLTKIGGEEAAVWLPEGAAGSKASKSDRQVFELTSDRRVSDPLRIAFNPGPFNWEDYARENWNRREKQRFRDSLWLATQLARRDRGTVSVQGDSQGTQLEVLDYLAHSALQRVPPLELNLLWKKTVRTTSELGEVSERPRNWERVQLDLASSAPHGRRDIQTRHVEMEGDENVYYSMTPIPALVEAFRNGLPDPSKPFGKRGQLVLYHNGTVHYFDVDELLRATEENKRTLIPGTRFEIGDVQFRVRAPLIYFVLHSPDGVTEAMHLCPNRPEMNAQAEELGVFGNYWVEPSVLKDDFGEQIDDSVLNRLALPTLELLQGPDKQLYYRYIVNQTVPTHGVISGAKDAEGKKIRLTLGQGTTEEAEFVLEKFTPQDYPGYRIVSGQIGESRMPVQRVQLRVSVDGNEDTFWLRIQEAMAVPPPLQEDQRRFVYGKNRTVRVEWKNDSIDLGFGIFLKHFDTRREPGTRMSTHYSSWIDFVEMTSPEAEKQGFSLSQDDFRVLRGDVWIRMNQPGVFQGKNSRKRYRIYQASCTGPFHPGDMEFHQYYDGRIFPWETRPRETLYTSTLSVNYDPGRGCKYLGSFLIIFGTAWLFYRKPKRS